MPRSPDRPRTRSASSPSTPWSGRTPAIPGCRWAWRTPRSCCGAVSCATTRRARTGPIAIGSCCPRVTAACCCTACLHLSGYDLSLDELKRFRQWGSRTPGHPEFGHTAGVEATTGPLGQGVGNAVGMALAARMLAARFNGDPDVRADRASRVRDRERRRPHGRRERRGVVARRPPAAWETSSSSTTTTGSRSRARRASRSPRTWRAATRDTAGTSRASTATITKRWPALSRRRSPRPSGRR